MYRHLIMFALLACLLSGAARAATLTLVDKGNAVGEIVLPPSPSSAELFVANDFQHWVREITGATVPVVSEATSGKKTRIHLGSALASQWQDDLNRLQGSDGFSMRHKGNDVYVFGVLPRGSAYGMYHLLEVSTDIIWARPYATFGTLFSKTDTLKLNLTDTFSKPAFEMRGWNVAGIRKDRDTGIWVWRNRGNYADQTRTDDLQMVSKLGGGHAFFGTMAPPLLKDESGKTLFERHPEYYSYDDARGGRYPGTLCLTNKDLPAESAKNVIVKIRALAQLPDFLELGMRDSWDMCKCEECQKPIKLADGSVVEMQSISAERDPVFHSTRYFTFMNEVAAEICKTYPNMRIMVLSYFYAAQPPRCDLHPSIIPLFCPVGGKNPRYALDDAGQTPIWRERFNEWRARYGNRLAIYEYYFGVNEPAVGFGMSRTTIAPDLQALHAGGGVGVYPELMPDIERKFRISLRRVWDANGMSAWVIARLFWNPNQDVTALRDTYLDRVYREAAPEMKKFYDLLEASWDSQTHGYKNRGEMFKAMIVDRGIEAACNDALASAEKLAVHPNTKIMLESLKREWVDYSESLSRNSVPLLNADEAKLIASDFESPLWDQALVFEDFRRMRHWDWGAMRAAAAGTQVSLVHDGVNLHVRTIAQKPAEGTLAVMAKSSGTKEQWPSADHVELMLQTKVDSQLFAYDANGNQYDALNLDRRWNSGWQLKSRRTEKGWESLMMIPLSALRYDKDNAGEELTIVIIRQAVSEKMNEESSLNGDIPGQRERIRLILD